MNTNTFDIFVGGLIPGIRENDLAQVLSQTLQGTHMIQGMHFIPNKNIGFVKLKTEEAQQKVLALDTIQVKGQRLFLRPGNKNKARTAQQHEQRRPQQQHHQEPRQSHMRPIASQPQQPHHQHPVAPKPVVPEVLDQGMQYELLKDMKRLYDTNPDTLSNTLKGNPQLLQQVINALLQFGMVKNIPHRLSSFLRNSKDQIQKNEGMKPVPQPVKR
ncbi:hypothetical protein PCE1_002680 [Barthelona sp. PCE]